VLGGKEQEQFVVGNDVLGVLASVADVYPDVNSECVHVFELVGESVSVECNHTVVIEDTVLPVGIGGSPKFVEILSAIPNANLLTFLKFEHVLFVSGHALRSFLSSGRLPVWGVAMRLDWNLTQVSILKT